MLEEAIIHNTSYFFGIFWWVQVKLWEISIRTAKLQVNSGTKDISIMKKENWYIMCKFGSGAIHNFV